MAPGMRKDEVTRAHNAIALPRGKSFFPPARRFISEESRAHYHHAVVFTIRDARDL